MRSARTRSLALAIGFALLASALLQACNTTEGIGKDISAGGRAVSGSASNVKEKL